jgi:hypothetical protein
MPMLLPPRGRLCSSGPCRSVLEIALDFHVAAPLACAGRHLVLRADRVSSCPEERAHDWTFGLMVRNTKQSGLAALHIFIGDSKDSPGGRISRTAYLQSRVPCAKNSPKAAVLSRNLYFFVSARTNKRHHHQCPRPPF